MKRRAPTIYKSFRLIDFAVYDDAVEIDSPASAQQDDGFSAGGGPRYTNEFAIEMFGLNEKGESCSIKIVDYKPFFYVKVPDYWEQDDTRVFLRFLENISGKKNIHLEGELVNHKKLYGFDSGKKHKFIRIIFKTAQHMNTIKNLWYVTKAGSRDRTLKKLTYTLRRIPKKLELELYEAGIPPLLRYFHIENISPSGWVRVPLTCCVAGGGGSSESESDDGGNNSRPAKKTTCNYEFVCRKSQVKPIENKETRVPYKICSFDIEASSSHGDFPVPKKTYKRLAANIVDALNSSTVPESPQYVAAVIKNAVLTAFGFGTMEDIDKVYPKIKPGEKYLRDLIEKLLVYDITDELAAAGGVYAAAGGGNKRRSLEDMFEQMAKMGSGAGDGDGGDGGDEGGDEGGAAAAAPDFDIVDSDPDDAAAAAEDAPAPARPRVRIVEPGAPPTITVCDILGKPKHTRDEKIAILNTILTDSIGFPEIEGDKVTFIGSTFMIYGEKEPYMNHCFVLGSCDPVEGATIETADTEYDLLVQWKELIMRENPDIIIGYNIFGFDYEFLFRRAEENHCVNEFLEMTRRIGEKSGKVNYHTNTVDDIEQTSVVLASGEYNLRYFKMTGRLQIDMYTYMRRDFNLPSYKLDDIAGQFIGDDIKKIELVGGGDGGDGGEAPLTHLYTNNITGLHVNDYIHIEITGFTTDYYGEKHKIAAILPPTEEIQQTRLVIAGHHTIDIKNKQIRWGLAKDDVSPQDIFRLANEGAQSRAIVAKYCIQDCNLVHHLLNKIDVITGYIEMSRICSVPISFLVFRGQGIKLTSYVAKKCRERDTLMPDLPRGRGDDGYEGAIVLPPKCSMYFDNPVACVDYASLYPSSMISENLSHDSKVWTKEYNMAGELTRVTGEQNSAGEFIYDNLPGYDYVDVEFDTYKNVYPKTEGKRAAAPVKTKCGKMVCRWAQFPDGQKGIMPSILEELLKARSDTRKLAKTVADPFMQNILDKRQLGYKVTANSLYGQCGAKTSTFYEKDIAASTTATGRKMITYAKRIIEEIYGNTICPTSKGDVRTRAEYVYGDTDSVFFTFNLEYPTTNTPIRGKDALELTIELAQQTAELCTRFLKTPMELAYEKTLMPFILLSKKRYVGMLYETNPNKGKMKYMGLSLKRRDSCDYLKDTYGNIIKMLMAGENVSATIEYLNRAMTDLVEGRVPIEKLMLTRSLRSDYKNPNQIAHKVLADRIGKRDPGNKPKSGDRLKFAFIVNSNPRALLGERIETPEFIAENRLKIDYNYYITNQLMKPLQQLFGLAIEQIYIERGRSDTTLRSHRRELQKLQREFPDMELYMKKREIYCSKEIKKLLFDDMLSHIQNKRTGNKEITSFFRPK
jgi:DNA polymerase elongation subunit (family B)